MLLWHTFLIAIFIAFSGGLYFLPAFVAFARRHNNKAAIALVDLFFGWTFLGWIAALIWAFTSPATNQVVVVQQPPLPPQQ